jgi:membrane protein
MTSSFTRVKALAKRGRALFPVRVWIHFLDRNGLLLSAGMSYQALFAVFAAVYVGFSITAIWFASRPGVMLALMDIVNTAIPGMIGDDGVVSPSDITAAVDAGASVVTVTGLIALGSLIWTAIGWITFSRMAVRNVFMLEKDRRNYAILKAQDLVAALFFGALLLVAAVLSAGSSAALDWVVTALGMSTDSLWFTGLARVTGLALVFLINTLVLAAMFRFLSRAAIKWRRLAGGSALGGLALLIMQVLGSVLIGATTRNPLLASFTVLIGFLLFFRLMGIVTLAAAAWITVGAADRDESLRLVSPGQLERERAAAERRALLLAARVRLREAESDHAVARWFEKPSALRQLRAAERELASLDKTET